MCTIDFDQQDTKCECSFLSERQDLFLKKMGVWLDAFCQWLHRNKMEKKIYLAAKKCITK